MTTVHSYESLPPPGIEVYLSPDELRPGALYEIESDYLEKIAYCVDYEHFFGIHIEDRNNVFSIRLSREPHIRYSDRNGVSSGSKPIQEFIPRNTSLLPKNYSGTDLTRLLIQQSYEHYYELHQNIHLYPEQKDVIISKFNLFSKITESWKAGKLQPPDDHGYLNISTLKQVEH